MSHTENHYSCAHCNVAWTDTADVVESQECPECGRELTPEQSHMLCEKPLPEVLRLRTTFKYVGSYRDLDEWQDIGTMDQLCARPLPVAKPDDLTEPRCVRYHVMVNAQADVETIRTALADHYDVGGCAHDYDCCGCRSFYTRNVARVCGVSGSPTSLWLVDVYSARNY